MNGNNIEYIVVFGSQRFRPDTHIKTAERFDYIRDAREYAGRYLNAYIFRVQYTRDSGDVLYITEI